MDEILKFLNKAGIFYLATTHGNQPHVRPLGFVMEYDGKLMFCTSNNKNMYKQLVANPNAELSCVDSDNNTLRITGKVVFATSRDTQQKALETMPMLSKMYSVGDGKFEIFYFDHAKAICSTMTGQARELHL
ncbi:pyridoxamine 5'-phosphate oxidase family protein [Fusobacterium sp. PH5-44]|uniref:pyridoxamine 5'-phosphate oxidase family protein n=1 Tax=unclassified Fusobacterium TaxID=2648384 RepID=UPI003D1FCF38